MSDGLPMAGPAAPPRDNGELAFEEPWQVRAFGMAAALVDAGVVTWDDVRSRLIAQIGEWDRADVHGRDDWHYYDHFVAALETLVDDHGLVAATELDQRADAYAARPAGHDH